MNVWVLGYGIPTDKYPVNGIFSYNQAQAIAELYPDINVTYFGLDIRSIRRWRKWGIHSYYEKKNFKVVDCSIPVGNAPMELKRIIYATLFRIAINKELKGLLHPDIVHAHFTEIGAAMVACKDIVKKSKLVFTEHSSGINADEINDFTRKIANDVYNNADKLLAVSPTFVKKIRNEFGVEAEYVPNAIDENVFCYKAKQSDSDRFEFISVGRLVPGKNFKMLIKAFCKAFSNDTTVKLTIIGDGEEKDKLQKLINKYSLQNQIELIGAKTNHEVADYLHKSDCFVLASNSETFGVVCAEALMTGTPVLSTRCGGPECMINKNNGLLVAVNSIDEMAASLQSMKHNKDKYNAINISDEATRLFAREQVIKRIVGIYMDLQSR